MIAAGVAAALQPMQGEIASLRTGLAAQAAPTVVQNLGAATDGGRRDGIVRVGFGQAPIEQLQTVGGLDVRRAATGGSVVLAAARHQGSVPVRDGRRRDARRVPAGARAVRQRHDHDAQRPGEERAQ